MQGLGQGLGPGASPAAQPHGDPGGGARTRYWKSQISPSRGLSPARRVLLLEVRMLNLRNLGVGGERSHGGGGRRDPRGSWDPWVGTGPAHHSWRSALTLASSEGPCKRQRRISGVGTPAHPAGQGALGTPPRATREPPQLGGRPPIDVDRGLHAVVAVVQADQQAGAGAELAGRAQHQRPLGCVGHAGLLLHHEGAGGHGQEAVRAAPSPASISPPLPTIPTSAAGR